MRSPKSVVLVLALLFCGFASADENADLAERLLGATPRKKGICAVIGGDGRLPGQRRDVLHDRQGRRALPGRRDRRAAASHDVRRRGCQAQRSEVDRHAERAALCTRRTEGPEVAIGGTPPKYPAPPVTTEYENAWGFGRKVLACDLKTGETVWTHSEPTDIGGRCIGLTLSGKLCFYADAARVVSLDGRTGKLIWGSDGAELVKALTAKGPFGHGGLQMTRPGLLCTEKVLTFSFKGRKSLVGVSTETGKLLWIVSGRKGGLTHAFSDGGKIVSGHGVLDPLTGKAAATGNINTSGCGPATVSPHGYYGRHGLEIDRACDNVKVLDHSFRSARRA